MTYEEAKAFIKAACLELGSQSEEAWVEEVKTVLYGAVDESKTDRPRPTAYYTQE